MVREGSGGTKPGMSFKIGPDGGVQAGHQQHRAERCFLLDRGPGAAGS